MPDLSRYSYDPASRRFRDNSTGSSLSVADVRTAVDAVIVNETVNVRDLAQRLVSGQITLASWQSSMATELKALYVAVGIVANGGLAMMTQSAYGYLGSLIKVQYTYLQNFVQDIASGRQALTSSVLVRASLYVEAARAMFEDILGHVARMVGCTEVRSILGISDHCRECLQEAKKGWSPIGSLIPIGKRICEMNCHCTMQYQ